MTLNLSLSVRHAGNQEYPQQAGTGNVTDTETFGAIDDLRQRAKFIEALREGEMAIAEGRVHSAANVIRELKEMYGH